MAQLSKIRRSSSPRVRAFRSKTRFLLKQLKDEMNDGEVSTELNIKLDKHFKTLYKFRLKH